MTEREALKLALDYIVATNKSSEFWLIPASNLNKTVTAIKEALREHAMYEVQRLGQEIQPEQEPVANDWSVFNTSAEVWSGLSLDEAVVELTPERMERGWSAVCVINKDNPPAYTTPPQRKPPNAKDFEDYCKTLHPLWNTRISRTEAEGFFHAGWLAAHGIKE